MCRPKRLGWGLAWGGRGMGHLILVGEKGPGESPSSFSPCLSIYFLWHGDNRESSPRRTCYRTSTLGPFPLDGGP